MQPLVNMSASNAAAPFLSFHKMFPFLEDKPGESSHQAHMNDLKGKPSLFPTMPVRMLGSTAPLIDIEHVATFVKEYLNRNKSAGKKPKPAKKDKNVSVKKRQDKKPASKKLSKKAVPKKPLKTANKTKRPADDSGSSKCKRLRTKK